MYIAEQFALTTSQALDVVASVGVGDLITYGERGLDVTYLPFSLSDDRTHLHTHISRVNHQWADDGPAMIVVHGPESYVSAVDMPPKPDGRLARVPTWNYVTVHLRGQVTFRHDEQWIMDSLDELVTHHDTRWSMADAPEEKMRAMVPAIVGVDFQIESVEGKAKLSQNLSSDELSVVMENLRAKGAGECAQAMETYAVPYVRGREERVARAQLIVQQRRKD